MRKKDILRNTVGILIPVYNSEQNIENCLNSIVNQTYKNIEVVIVDDGSTDNSGNICDKYQKKDNRIKVFHIKNSGVANARNYAIKKCNSDYITFIDSDDYVDLNYIEVLYKIMRKNDADIVSCDLKYCTDLIKKKNEIPKEIYILNKKQAMESLMYGKKISNGPTCKLFKKSLFSDIEFPVGKLFEDLGTIYKVIDRTKKVAYINEKKYYYFQNYTSITHAKFNDKSLYILECGETIMNFIYDNYPEIKMAGDYMYFSRAVDIARIIPLKNKYKPEINKIKNILRRYRKKIIKNEYARRHMVFFAYCAYFGIYGIKLGNFIFCNIMKLKIRMETKNEKNRNNNFMWK